MLSAAIISRNEESVIGRALASIRPYTDEIIVVDTGSEDSTIEIARQFDARIIERPWTDDFSEARNSALSACRGNWILSVDCDEELLANNAVGGFLQSLAANSAEIAYVLPIHNTLTNGQVETHQVIRLFRNLPDIRFSGPIHESVSTSIHRLRPNSTVSIAPFALQHCGYESLEKNKKKVLRNTHILLKWVHDEPSNSYAWYKLGLTLRAAGAEKATACLFRSFELLVSHDDRHSFAFRDQLIEHLLGSLKGPDLPLASWIKAEADRAFS
jgi:hypothetical protein